MAAWHDRRPTEEGHMEVGIVKLLHNMWLYYHLNVNKSLPEASLAKLHIRYVRVLIVTLRYAILTRLSRSAHAVNINTFPGK